MCGLKIEIALTMLSTSDDAGFSSLNRKFCAIVPAASVARACEIFGKNLLAVANRSMVKMIDKLLDDSSVPKNILSTHVLSFFFYIHVSKFLIARRIIRYKTNSGVLSLFASLQFKFQFISVLHTP